MATDYAVAIRLAQAVETITLEMGRLGVLVNVPTPEIPGNKDRGIATAVRLECIADFLGRVNLELSSPKADVVDEPVVRKVAPAVHKGVGK
jgi:hypothetical protein